MVDYCCLTVDDVNTTRSREKWWLYFRFCKLHKNQTLQVGRPTCTGVSQQMTIIVFNFRLREKDLFLNWFYFSIEKPVPKLTFSNKSSIYLKKPLNKLQMSCVTNFINTLILNLNKTAVNLCFLMIWWLITYWLIMCILGYIHNQYWLL